MNQIFISYARSDGSEMAEFLYQRLTGCGYKVWKDDHNIPLGTSFPREISNALEEKGDFILLVTSASLKSAWVGDEINMAKTARRRIIPVILDNKLIDEDIPLFLRSTNWLRMQDTTRDWRALSRLVDELEGGKDIPRVINMSGYKEIVAKGILILAHSEFGLVDLAHPKSIIDMAQKMAQDAQPFVDANVGIVPHGHPALACTILAYLLGTTTRMPNLYNTYRTENGGFGVSSDRCIALQSVREMGFEFRSHL